MKGQQVTSALRKDEAGADEESVCSAGQPGKAALRPCVGAGAPGEEGTSSSSRSQALKLGRHERREGPGVQILSLSGGAAFP